MVRMLAFMPVAAPVWAGETLCTIRLLMEANARPIPRPNTPAATATSAGVPCRAASSAQATAPSSAPVTSCALAGNRPASRPPRMPATNIAPTIGSISSPAPVTLDPKP